MKPPLSYLLLTAAITDPLLFGAQGPVLLLQPSAAKLELSWPAAVRQADGSLTYPLFELQGSTDLDHWSPHGERLRALSPAPDQFLRVPVPPDETQSFYRLLAIDRPPVATLSAQGAELFGYADAFARELQRIGQVSPEQFANLFPTSATYLHGITWDPTTAAFWQEFNADPDKINEAKEAGQVGFRWRDYRLTPKELATFKQNGFVVSERLGAGSFADVFYGLWHSDLPVFISCDAILQAWHRTYDAILEEVEEAFLFASLEKVLNGMAAQVNVAAAEIGSGPLKDSLQDADYFLTVARALLAGSNAASIHSSLGQNQRAAQTLADIREQKMKQLDDFMGFCRTVDFSQFKVRGHYTHTERLARYFQCMIWLGRIDIPVAGGPWRRCPGQERFASPRELGAAIVLCHLLKASDRFDLWRDMERTISVFVGTSDSLNFAQLSGLLAGAGIRTLGDLRDLATLERLQQEIIAGELGIQNIRSDWFAQPFGGAATYALPQTFAFFPQKFVPDAWALSQTVFSSILWGENGTTNKVMRRVPAALDVAFSVLGNDQVVPDLLRMMKGQYDNSVRPHAQTFRDGLNYQHNLAAVRNVMNQHTPDAWNANLYMNWLACLRELSAPTTEAQFPEAMRTRAWAMKTLNTQLASWTHLRHDTLLHAKHSYTADQFCVYPAGFVEPRLEFWTRLDRMAAKTADQIATLKYEGEYVLNSAQAAPISMATIKQRQIDHLKRFSGVVSRLAALTKKELARECFTSEDLTFVDGLMEAPLPRIYCGGPYAYSGWYPGLFYQTIFWTNTYEFHWTYGASAFDALVADVHTDVPCDPCEDPGSVLHQAVGGVNLLLLAVDNGTDRFICAGPVLSHYEFEVIGEPRRLSDDEWSGTDSTRTIPALLNGEFGPGIIRIGPSDFSPDLPGRGIEGLAPPPWTQSYLVPR